MTFLARQTLLIPVSTFALAAAFALPACKPKPTPSNLLPQRSSAEKTKEFVDTFTHREIGEPMGEPPWIANVNAVDLDQDGLLDVLACEARDNEVIWIRQTKPDVFEEHIIASNMKAPVHAEAADMDNDGDLDVLVSIMGYVFPNNDKIGAVVILENDGKQAFTPHFVLEDTYRVTDIRPGDFNGDGRTDLAVGQFGYDQGEVRWMERVGPWEFRSHSLLGLSGAINVCVDDFNGDSRPDIVALVSQQWEEVYYFQNEGNGTFAKRRIWGSTNEDYGSSGICVADMNGDARPDIVYTNGDGFGPSAVPGPRPWHGVQWFENTGNGFFRYHRVGNLPGAYSPVAVDLDEDGAMDIVASSAYADWERKGAGVISLMWFRNDGNMTFAPRVLAYAPRDLITLAAGKFGADEQYSLVTGGFPVYPPYDICARISLWSRNLP